MKLSIYPFIIDAGKFKFFYYHINIYLFIIIIGFTSCHTIQNIQTTQPVNQVGKDTRGNDMLLGKCTRDALEKAPFSEWFKKNYDEYKTDEAAVSDLKLLLKDKTITIFLGTWCGDSKREVPRMMKILEAIGFPEKKIHLIMVSNHAGMYKQSPQHEETGKNIIRVPTFIFYENEKEIGRIIESPIASLEKDMLKILKRESYKPNYTK